MVVEPSNDFEARIWLQAIVKPDLEPLSCQNVDDVELPRGDPPGPALKPLERYKVAGKLGPWARGGCEGERFLDMGLQGRPKYMQILKAERDGDDWRYVRVIVKEGEHLTSTYPKWCGTNVYKRAGKG